MELTLQRCLNHSAREAVARCPVCLRFFCRECVTEHDDRMICTACLRKTIAATEKKRPMASRVARVVPGALGLLVAWFFFYLIGSTLLSLPDSFHEASLWQVPWYDQ